MKKSQKKDTWVIVGITTAVLITCFWRLVPTKKETSLTEFTPNNTATYNNRGIAYAEKGDYDDAIQNYTKAIELDPNDTATFNNRGIAYAKKGYYDDAIRDFTKVIELDPNCAKMMVTIGLMYEKKGDKENARQWWKKALEKKTYLSESGEKIVRQWLKDVEK